MLSGKSVFHTYQKKGFYYELEYIKGYYSDLRHKVLGNTLLDEENIPYNITNDGRKVYFIITILQYGLGAYDLYLETNNNKYRDMLLNIADYTIEKQSKKGSWDTFGFQNKNFRYSSMAQGEAASLLIRAYVETGEEKYLDAAKKAIDFMLLSIENGGTTNYFDNYFIFEESLEVPGILNGMFFSLWGLWDYYIISNDKSYLKVLTLAAKSIAKVLPDYDLGYWTKYDLKINITSPFYHDLHINQLDVTGQMFPNIGDFHFYKDKWKKYNQKKHYKFKAFIVKALQKVKTINNKSALVQ